ncbi:glycoside hydrolase domain-containing protein [Kitasatospora kifunensis]|uniref:Bulb-type lectin domain-containing protein n=1 Tax=Kitasatospora kifunensis TaxID=58351 RepID=A0A7W7R1Q3_KITKI|nr:glycoside hydrolase domain-containing protein [Kitasatospora kifunensis]MBB4923645.1 hypothetical protein [Kitasatospora kifunensis]
MASTTAVVLLATAGLAAAVPSAQAEGTAGSRTVDYQGYQVQVPASWQVVDLAQNPNACVRFDQNTVYLGTPGVNEDCPAHLGANLTDALVIQPTPTPVAGAPAAPVVDPGTALPSEVLSAGALSHQLRAQLRGTGLQVTASYGNSPQQVNAILAGAKATGSTSKPVARAPRSLMATPRAGVNGAATVAPRTNGAGAGFDACTAPSAGQMTAWKSNSQLNSVGIYIGGRRACAQPNLTAGWVSDRTNEGWTFLPIYVGLDASTIAGDAGTARSQGAAAATDAINQAQSLGFTSGSVLYNDMESYSSASYKSQVLNYLSGWTDAIHAANFRSGVYASASSGVSDLASVYNTPGYSMPDVIWSASWGTAPDTTSAAVGLSGASSGYWPGGRRVHQYAGDTTVNYGGISGDVDLDNVNVNSEASGNIMQPGQQLDPGNSVSSASVTLTMQTDGDLAVSLKVGGTAAQPVLWHTGTSGNPGAYVVMQLDGNLVVYRPDGTAIWNTYSNNKPGASLHVQDDGNVVLYDANNGPVWSTDAYKVPSTFNTGQGLAPGRWAENALTRVVVQADGNFVIYRKRDGAVLWTPNTFGNPGAYLTMQADGNLVLYRKGGSSTSGGALWSSNTFGNPGAYALNQDDGNFVVYKQGGGPSSGGALWWTSTYLNAN